MAAKPRLRRLEVTRRLPCGVVVKVTVSWPEGVSPFAVRELVHAATWDAISTHAKVC